MLAISIVCALKADQKILLLQHASEEEMQKKVMGFVEEHGIAMEARMEFVWWNILVSKAGITQEKKC